MQADAVFLYPQVLWLLLVLPLIAIILVFRKKPRIALVKVPVLYSFGTKNLGSRLRPFLVVLRLAALGLLIVALARPQSTDVSKEKRGTEGIDIVMTVDISGSMRARDLKPNRLEALKLVGQEFVDQRPNDRIGLVIYAGESFGQVPLTTDHKIVKNGLDDLEFDMLQDGTAIGMGLATAVNRIKDSEALSKVIILLTDGENNTGIIDPKTATQIAQELNIKVYTIGVGTKGLAEMPVAQDFQGNLIYQKVPVNIDEDLLKYIADATNAKYFRATDNESLSNIYKEIDALEKTELEELTYYQYQEHFYNFVFLAIGFLLLELVLRFTIFRSFI